MNKIPNVGKNLLQWGVILSIAVTILWATIAEKEVDVEAYCPFGGLQALGSYWVNQSLACSMSILQIMMGVVLAFGVIFFSKLFCGYLCPMGTVEELMGKVGRKFHIQKDFKQGSIPDRMLRSLKYGLLFWILYNTLSTSELFCKKLDPFYAVATGFQGEIVLWMSLVTLTMLILGGFFIRMFWCRYICPLGALSNIFKFTPLVLLAGIIAWLLSENGIENGWVWVIGMTCLISYLYEMLHLKSKFFPVLTIQRDAELCVDCKRCDKKCPYHLPISREGKLRYVDCTLCGECISKCPTNALSINGKHSLRWIPALLTVVLFGTAWGLASITELPTIDEKWGNYEQKSGLKIYELEGLQTIKCFGSSKAFSAKMQGEKGVYGVKTFVGRHAVEILYDPIETDTINLQKVIFTPTQRKYRTPSLKVPQLKILQLGIEGLHDRMDMVYFGMAMQQVKGVYGFTSAFGCPIQITMFVDPKAELNEEILREKIEAKELVFHARKGDKIFPMNNELRSYKEKDFISREDFTKMMFLPTANLSHDFKKDLEKWSDTVKYPRGIYEMVYPSIEKILVQKSVPYLKSFLAGKEGILRLEFALNQDLIPVLRLYYVQDMWDEKKIWQEIFQAKTWKITLADGSTQDMPAKLKFSKEGHRL